MTREEVWKLMHSAKTLEECARAWEARDAYLLEHPDDEAVLDEGEMLRMTEEALKQIAAQKEPVRVAS